jgi:hypothetical protein
MNSAPTRPFIVTAYRQPKSPPDYDAHMKVLYQPGSDANDYLRADSARTPRSKRPKSNDNKRAAHGKEPETHCAAPA